MFDSQREPDSIGKTLAFGCKNTSTVAALKMLIFDDNYINLKRNHLIQYLK